MCCGSSRDKRAAKSLARKTASEYRKSAMTNMAAQPMRASTPRMAPGVANAGRWSPKGFAELSRNSLEQLRQQVQNDMAASPLRVNRPSWPVHYEQYQRPAETKEDIWARNQVETLRQKKSRGSKWR
ncbi:hypothetical protein FOBRF1_009623 [Fusarium oxysporum]